MMNFRKIAAASKGRLLLRYFTENTPEPIHPAALDAAGRQLEEGGRLTAYYTGPRQPGDLAAGHAGDACAKAIGDRPPADAARRRDERACSRAGGPTTARPGRSTSASCRGFDLVFSPHKSVTLAAEFAATPAESAALWNAIDRANDRGHALRRPGARLGAQGRGRRGRRRSRRGRLDQLPAPHGAADAA